MSLHVRVSSALLAFLLGVGCGPSNPFENEGRLMGIDLVGPANLAVGDSARIDTYSRVGGVMGLLSYDRLLDARWSSSDPSVLAVVPRLSAPGDSLSPMGAMIRGLRPGSATVTATARGVSGSLAVTVTRMP